MSEKYPGCHFTGVKTHSNTSKVLLAEHYNYANSLIFLTTEEREIFIGVYSVIVIVGLIANVCVIFCIIARKNRYIQKTCILSLTAADLLALISLAINNLETFSHPLINWTLGKFMCGAIPVAQVYGILASSFSLLIIAMDRYRNIVHAMNRQWNPSLRSCIIGAIILWICCGEKNMEGILPKGFLFLPNGGLDLINLFMVYMSMLAISYPMSTYFTYGELPVIFTNGSSISHCEHLHMCVSFKKNDLIKYHISLTCIIFLPILIAFIWFYYKIALLIWRHRKPISPGKRVENEHSTTKSTDIASKNDLEVGVVQTAAQKKKDVHVERKMRTLKIIITVLFVFIACRLPYWIYFALKNYFAALNGHWTINYSMICLSLLNCALNPFLYTFLIPTIRSLSNLSDHLKEFVCLVCCCWVPNGEINELDRDDQLFSPKVQKRTVHMEHGKFTVKMENEGGEIAVERNNNLNKNNIAVCNRF